MTCVPTRVRRVWAAMNVSVVYASIIGSSGGRPTTGIWKKWSMVQMLSTPASSAVRASRAIVGPISLGGAGHEKLVMLMPSFMRPGCRAQPQTRMGVSSLGPPIPPAAVCAGG